MGDQNFPREAAQGRRVSALASPFSAITRVFRCWSFVLVIPVIFILSRIADIRISALHLINPLKAAHVVWPTLYSQYAAFWAAAMPSEAERYLLFMAVTLLANAIFAVVVLSLSLKNGIMRLNANDVLVLLAFLPGFVYELWLNVPKIRAAPIWDFYIDGIGLYFIRESILIHSVFLFACLAIVFLWSLFAGTAERKRDHGGI
jgi:hypothetical protein